MSETPRPSRVLVTGGTGLLGRALVERLNDSGYRVRATSRHPQPPDGRDVEWVQMDPATGAGLERALEGIEAVIHAVNSAGQDSYEVNVRGIERLLLAAEGAGSPHVIYPSIAGIDRFPLAYYRDKLAAEERIEGSDLPWTILRATQFYEFVDYILGQIAKLPVLLSPIGAKVQPVDVHEVADVLVRAVQTGPAKRLPDFGGPQELTFKELLGQWKAARGIRKPIVPLPLPTARGRALRNGALTAPVGARGAITWRQWLAQTYR